MSDRLLCPECAVGKHGNCNGDAWDFDKDTLTRCECLSFQHVGKRQDPRPG